MERFVTTRLLALSVVALGVLDAFITKLDWDPLHEVNPLMFAIRDTNMFYPVKVGATTFGVIVLLFLANKYPRQIRKIFIGLTTLMTSVCILNAVALFA